MNANVDLDRMLAQDLGRVVADPRFQHLHKALNRFNPFKVLRVERYELRHTNTLAWLLDPQGSHGLGRAFLNVFLRRIDAFAPGFAGLEQVEVETQASLRAAQQDALDIDAGGEDTGRASGADRPDIIVEGRDKTGAPWLMAIEAKVDSREGDQQLQRYDRSLRERCPGTDAARFYLTVAADDEISSRHWKNILWTEHVGGALDEVLATAAQMDGRVRDFLEDYAGLVGALAVREAEADPAHALANDDAVATVLRSLDDRVKAKGTVRAWDAEPWAQLYSEHRAGLDMCRAVLSPPGAVLVWNTVRANFAAREDWEIISSENKKKLTVQFVPRQWAGVPGLKTPDGRWNLYYHAEFREQQRDIELKLYCGRMGDRVMQRDLVRRLFGPGLARRPGDWLAPPRNTLEKFMAGGLTVKLYTRKAAWTELEDGKLALEESLRDMLDEFEVAAKAHDAAVMALKEGTAR